MPTPSTLETHETRPISRDSAEHALRDVEQPHLVLLLQRDRLLAGGARWSLANLDRVTLGRGPIRSARRLVEGGKRTLAITVPDARTSAAHAVLERTGAAPNAAPDGANGANGANGGWVLRDVGSTNGTVVGEKRVTSARLDDGAHVELGRTLFAFRAALPTPVTAPADVDASQLAELPATLATLGPRLTRELETLARVARSDVPILLLGETGTGKEVLARGVHTASGRPGPFVAVNCGALPSGLVEAMLFGHRKGAFSGALQDEPGFVRAAHGGTLLLDEIGDLPEAAQATLLRVLQEREVVPIGATRPVSADVRVVAATHRPLAALVRDGSFRSDLYARLSAYTFTLPPLRERMDDIGLLVAAILGRAAGERAGTLVLGPSAAQAMLAHRWPLNVRELEQRLKVSWVVAAGDRIDRLAIDTSLEAEMRSPSPSPARHAPGRLSATDETLRAELVAKLVEHGGNVTHASESLGKARPQVHRWIKRLGIDPRDYRR